MEVQSLALCRDTNRTTPLIHLDKQSVKALFRKVALVRSPLIDGRDRKCKKSHC